MRITFGLSVAVVNYNREKNIGALFRTAEAFGAQNFMIIGNREIEGKDVEDILSPAKKAFNSFKLIEFTHL